MTIYLIEGTTGEYDDRTTWIVRSFKDKDDADSFIFKLESLYNGIAQGLPNNGYYNKDIRLAINNVMSTLDTNFRMDYTGTYYRIVECELEE